MKKTFLNKILPILVGISIIVLLYFNEKRNTKIDEEIYQKGLFCKAIINGEVATKGGTRTIKYYFHFGKKVWQFERYVSNEFYREKDVGDTIIIKILPTDLPESLICEKREYKSCFGKQPVNGWKVLPKCN